MSPKKFGKFVLIYAHLFDILHDYLFAAKYKTESQICISECLKPMTVMKQDYHLAYVKGNVILFFILIPFLADYL